MWAKLLLVCFLALALAEHHGAWEKNLEYIYEVRGRLLTSLNQINNNYTGILLKGELFVRPTSEGHLKAKVVNLHYANIHAKLSEDWEQYVPDSELGYKEMQLSSKPFQIMLKDGVIDDLIVDKSIANWEANIIKGIVSQLQLDTEGENYIRSSINTLSQDETNTAVFKTMEKTVTGETETLYQIHPLPEYILQTTPWLVPVTPLNRQSQYIEVVKSKNFTHSRQRPSYNFGFDGVKSFDLNNQIGEFFSRTSQTRAVLSGSLKSYRIQSSVTVEQIIVRPNFQDEQAGLTGSIVNITLKSVGEESQEFEDVPSSINVGLIYQYNQPFSLTNEPMFRKYASSDSSESESNEIRRPRHKRDTYPQFTSSESASLSTPEEYFRVQEQPHINEAPPSPLLPYTVGYNGQAISMQKNIGETVRNLAKKIGQEFQQPELIPEKQTVSKFRILSSLVRVMKYQEIKEVSDHLYTSEQRGAVAAAWIAYRDAVAQAGTGPALLNIEEWIRFNKIPSDEAAEIVETAAFSARQPTEKYMKVFFGMIQTEQIMQKKYLNESLILAYTELVRKVYVDPRSSHDNYPVHSYGTFNTAQGRRFVVNEVIPYFAAKLDKAISRTDTKQIHLYIRALGNIAHKQILVAMKPYLEGTKKASQFQRFLMVLALEELTRSNSKAAQNVLYKLYRNPRESEQIRVAAVNLLVVTYPSPTMLQRMAMYTNIDTSVHVNSAVKSAIESLALIKSPRYSQVREAAASAKPYLTSQDFGVQNSKTYLQAYIVEQMPLEIKHALETYGGEDSVLPKGIYYTLRATHNGHKHEGGSLHAMVSSVEDFVNVWERQTKQYRRLLKEKQAFEGVKTKWSSQYLAKLLNLQNEQREQLEGYLYFHSNVFQKIWSFDNHTIDNITEVIRELEQELQNGKHFLYRKMTMRSEAALSFPTAWGLPFLFTYDQPIIANIESDVKAVAKPPLYSQDGIQKPETVDIEYHMHGFLSGKIDSQFGFFSPFNHRRYSAGYDKNFQIFLPKASGKVHIDVENQQTTWEVLDIEKLKNVNLVHFSSWPYTSQSEIWSPDHKTDVIRHQHPHVVDTVVGDKSTGVAFSLKMKSGQPIDYGFLYNRVSEHGWLGAILGSWVDDNIQNVEIDLSIDGHRTTTQKLTVQLGYQEKYTPGLKSGSGDFERIRSEHSLVQESWNRQKEFVIKSRKDISNVEAKVVDIIAMFEGSKMIKYSATAAKASSNIDPKGRILLQVERKIDQERPVRFDISLESAIPNPPTLDFMSALNFNPTMLVKTHSKIETSGKSAEINAQVKFSKSQQRKQYLLNHPQYKECQKEMKDGNRQLPTCAILTVQANLLDQFEVDIDYKNVHPEVVNQTYKLYSALRHYWYPRLSEDIVIQKSRSNRIRIEGHYNPDLSAVNASMTSGFLHAEVGNIPVNEISRSVLVPHPAYDPMTRLEAHLLSYDTYHAVCVVDDNAVNTFDNKTYPVNLGKDWVVFLHYVPRVPSPSKHQYDLTVNEQLNQQLEEYILYVRSSGQNPSQKEIKMVIQSPNTMGKVVDITLKPSSSPSEYPRLFVQDEQIVYDEKVSHIYDDYMQVFKLPNNELKVEVYDSLNFVFDGVRAKVSVLSDKFHDATRGLCGTFTGEPETDFIHPGNCIISSPEIFVTTNTVSEKLLNKRMNDVMLIRAGENKCYQKTIGYVNVISAHDSGITEYDPLRAVMRPMMWMTTKYVNLGNQVCFSVEPMRRCRDSTKEHASERLVQAHCVQKSAVADMYKKQIDEGANPDFRSKGANKEVMMRVVERCDD